MGTERMLIKVFKKNKFPIGGYKINGDPIREEDCKKGPNGVACLHHMFDGPFEVTIYHDHDQNAPVLALEVECGGVIIYTANDPLNKRTVDVSGCRGASEGSEPVYVDATTYDQQVVMNALVREARREEGLGSPSSGYQRADIIISPNTSADSTKIRATNTNGMVVVDRNINGTGDAHGTMVDCT